MTHLPITALAHREIVEREPATSRSPEQIASQLKPGQTCWLVKDNGWQAFCVGHNHYKFPERCPACPPEPRRVRFERRTKTGILVMTDGTRVRQNGYRRGETGRGGWRTVLADAPSPDPYAICDDCQERKMIDCHFPPGTKLCHRCSSARTLSKVGLTPEDLEQIVRARDTKGAP